VWSADCSPSFFGAAKAKGRPFNQTPNEVESFTIGQLRVQARMETFRRYYAYALLQPSMQTDCTARTQVLRRS
jgi:hypothetical protein